MILKNDETHLQACLLEAVKKEVLTGTAAARQMVVWLRQRKFDKNGRAKDQKWFLSKLKEFPYEPAKPEAQFKFSEGEIAEHRVFIMKFKVKILQRWASGTTLTKKEVPFITQPHQVKQNAYLIEACDDPTQVDVCLESDLEKTEIRGKKA